MNAGCQTKRASDRPVPVETYAGVRQRHPRAQLNATPPNYERSRRPAAHERAPGGRRERRPGDGPRRKSWPSSAPEAGLRVFGIWGSSLEAQGVELVSDFALDGARGTDVAARACAIGGAYVAVARAARKRKARAALCS